jgi:hypothetical protein
MPAKPRIHFIENNHRMRAIPESSEWESGYWFAFGKEKAANLVGGEIYFHRAQKELSYGGGIITGFRIAYDGAFKGRYVFRYLPQKQFIGVTANGKWMRYKMVIGA